MKKIALFSVFMCVVFAVSATEPVQTSEVYGNAQVSATKLNLRMKPTIKSPRAGIIMKGTRVKVTAKKDGWLELEAPSSMPVYVSAVYLINGKLSNATKLRPTNDPQAPSFGVYPAGTKLKAIGSVDKFGWIKVEPPAGLLVYAYGDYIAIDKDAVIGEKKENKPAEAAPAPEKKPYPQYPQNLHEIESFRRFSAPGSFSRSPGRQWPPINWFFPERCRQRSD